jgi:glucosamine kinase
VSERDSLFLGVDGGGTRCRARLCNARGEMLGEGVAGPANIRFGVAQSFDAVLKAARQCFQKAGLAHDQLKNTTACLGLAGATEPVYLAAALSFRHPFRTIIITTDAQAACAGAHGTGDGGIIIAGTGSIGWAQLGGHQHRVGGWGFPVSDEGSGAWLGCEALRRVLWAHDGRLEWSPLLRTIFATFERDAHSIVRWMKMATPRDFGRITHEIVEYAARGDPVGRELMVLSAGHIDTLTARLRSLGVARIALFGGLAGSILPWLAPETRECLVEPKGDAVQGALEIAIASEMAPARSHDAGLVTHG